MGLKSTRSRTCWKISTSSHRSIKSTEGASCEADDLDRGDNGHFPHSIDSRARPGVGAAGTSQAREAADERGAARAGRTTTERHVAEPVARTEVAPHAPAPR